MNKTFYVPKGEAQLVADFTAICEAEGLNYSNVLVDAMRTFVKMNKPKLKNTLKREGGKNAI